MTRIDEPTETSLLEALNQNWLHVRHVETERLRFTSVHAMVVIGALTFLGTVRNSSAVLPSFSVYILHSWIDSNLTLKIDDHFDNHFTGIRRIIERLNLDEHMSYPTSYRKGLSLWKIIRVRHVFVGFYTVMILTCSYLLYLGVPRCVHNAPALGAL